MKQLSASEKRQIENATLLAASKIIFKRLTEIGQSLYPLGELISMSSGESLTSSQMDDSLPYPVYGGGGLTGYYSRYLFEHSNVRYTVERVEELVGKVEEVRSLRQKALEETELLTGVTISHLFQNSQEKAWIQRKLGDYVIDDCYGTSEKTNDDKLATPILRMGNIQKGCLDLRDLKYLHLNDKERERLLLKKGDILVNRTNSAELVGKCAVFEIEGEYAFASYIIRLRLDQNKAEPRLVAAYINSPSGRAYMFSERKQMTGQANVNAQKLKAMPISLPSLSEQRRIVVYLDELQTKGDTMKRMREQAMKELDALLPSILDKAFKGEL
ncbi:restriction endonuclease subunit S [Nostoc sp.]